MQAGPLLTSTPLLLLLLLPEMWPVYELRGSTASIYFQHLTPFPSFDFFFFFFFFFAISWAAAVAYGGSQARGLIRAVAASLRQSHSNARSEPRL